MYSPNGIDVTIGPGVDVTLGPGVDVMIAPPTKIDLPEKWEERHPEPAQKPKTKKSTSK